MSPETKKRDELEVGYVLFPDIVGYSKRTTNEQHALIDQLNQIVRSSETFQSAEATGRLIKISDRRWNGPGLLQKSGATGGMCA